MIQILKSKSGYRVRYSGKNGEPLAVSEVLTSKANAWKNVKSMMKLFTQSVVTVIDNNGDEYRALCRLNMFKKYIVTK
jgi:uncharacterized protein YegP (UPF0339 family)